MPEFAERAGGSFSCRPRGSRASHPVRNLLLNLVRGPREDRGRRESRRGLGRSDEMLGANDPFEDFREKKKIEKLQNKAKSDSGPIQGMKKARREQKPAFDDDRNWIY
jgi:hypothetical protein